MKNCYSTIELSKVKEMLGLSKEATPKFMTTLKGEHMGRQCPDICFSEENAGFITVSNCGN
jgi:hypothetical protein